MAIKAAIRNIALADPTLTGYISQRFKPVVAGTKDTLPHITYERTNISSNIQLDNVSDLRMDTFVFYINSNSYLECDNIAEQLKLVFESVYQQTEDDTYIARFYLEGYSENNYLPEGREKPIYETILTFDVSYG